MVTTKKANLVFGYPLLLTKFFFHFNIDLSSEPWESTMPRTLFQVVIQGTIKRQEFMMTRIYEQHFLIEGTSDGGDGEGESAFLGVSLFPTNFIFLSVLYFSF